MSIRCLAAAALVVSVSVPCLAQPVITSVISDIRPTSGGAMCRIAGTNFGLSPIVQFGGSSGTVLLASDTLILCTTPAGAGSTSITVINAGMVSNSVGYTYNAPVVSSLAPATGAAIAGGTPLTIFGSNFGFTPTVTIDGAAAPINSSTHTTIQCTVPSGIGTNKPVFVTSAAQSSGGGGPTLSYAGPTISTFSPSAGSTVGGGTMDILGANLGLSNNAPQVTIGGVIAPVVLSSPTAVRVTLPAGVGASLPVVLTRAGQSTTVGSTFSYFGPTVFSAIPNSGPTAGGTSITISGSNFGPQVPGQSSVTIGGTNAFITSWGQSSITALVPPGQGVNLPVVVTAGGQASPSSTVFSYNPPALTNIRPAFGPAQGGGPIIIDGQNFGTGGATVMIGGLPAVVTSQNHTSIACIAPPRSGTTPLPNALVQVTVASAQSNSLTYSYLCSADFNTVGGVSVQDIFDFLAAWFVGCP